MSTTHHLAPLRDAPGDERVSTEWDGTKILHHVHGSQSIKTMKADGIMLSICPSGALNYAGDDEGFTQAILEPFQDGVGGAALLRTMPSTEPTAVNGSKWAIRLLKIARDRTHGRLPAQRLRDILVAETRARHTGRMIRFLQDAVDTARECDSE